MKVWEIIVITNDQVTEFYRFFRRGKVNILIVTIQTRTLFTKNILK